MKQIISCDSYEKTKKKFPGGEKNYLRISEFYYDTIQGEGVSMGHPSAFLRLQGCTIRCLYCDTVSVWKKGGIYTFDELFKMIEETDLLKKFKEGQHLVLTGGSPLLQERRLTDFLQHFQWRYDFLPYIEIENECVVQPSSIILLISQWNNSPKLSNSGIVERVRYKPDVIKALSQFPNSWFKFVIQSRDDWNEIEVWFLKPQLIKENQVILMPECKDRSQLEWLQQEVAELAAEKGVKYSDRLQIRIWNKKTGV